MLCIFSSKLQIVVQAQMLLHLRFLQAYLSIEAPPRQQFHAEKSVFLPLVAHPQALRHFKVMLGEALPTDGTRFC